MSTIIHPTPVIGGAFCLVDHHGRTVDETRYLGRHTLFFFGFTHCRVVCPRALGKLSRALDRLGPSAERIQPFYVTVDPERDTPDVMRAFLEAYPRFLGLTGSRPQIDAAKSAFRVFARRREEDGGGYAMPHSSLTYVLDPAGRYRDHWPETLDEDAVVVRLNGAMKATHRA
jgi:protein SCO1/2